MFFFLEFVIRFRLEHINLLIEVAFELKNSVLSSSLNGFENIVLKGLKFCLKKSHIDSLPVQV